MGKIAPFPLLPAIKQPNILGKPQFWKN